MSLGMSRDEYWNGYIFNAFDYIEADKLRQERFNCEAWLQGMYVYNAFSVVMQNAFSKNKMQTLDYPSKPYDIFKSEQEQEEEEIKKAELRMAQMVNVGKNWGKKG